MSNHPERQGWDDKRMVLTEEGDDYTAYCSPEARGQVFVDEKRVSAGGRGSVSKGDAPFPFDIVFHGRFPNEGEVEDLSTELRESFREDFDSKVDEVYQHIEGADSTKDVIEALSPEDMGLR